MARSQFLQTSALAVPAMRLAGCLVDRFQQARFVERLFDEIIGPQLDCGHGHIYVAVAGDQRDRGRGVVTGEMAYEIEPAEAGHAYVSHHAVDPPRSEEPTSELQSLMRISYAVFCLKKKN